MTVAEVAAVLTPHLVKPLASSKEDNFGSNDVLTGVSIDSRSVGPGQLFFAIRGERFDGHDFLEEAKRKGACGFVVERKPQTFVSDTIFYVDDVVQALGLLAHAWRRRIDPTVVAITGSLGKTTTKELVAQMLACVGRTHATKGNLNNHLGLPLTLLAMPEHTQFCVVELGMSGLGEIAQLTAIAEPNVGVITAIAPVHLQQLGTMENVLKAKMELPEGLDHSATLIIADDDSRINAYMAKQKSIDGPIVTFGAHTGGDVQLQGVTPLGVDAQDVVLGIRGEAMRLRLALVGAHNARNAATAAAVGVALGLDPQTIIKGLEQPVNLGHRSRIEQIGSWHVLDDCYNASPDAVHAALKTVVDLARIAGSNQTIAVLGSMLELGDQSDALHQQLGQHVGELGVTHLIAVGEHAAAIVAGATETGMRSTACSEVDTVDRAAEVLYEKATAGAWILIKASRGAQLERVITLLREFARNARFEV